MKELKRKLTLDELKVDSLVTSISSEVSQRLAGGLGESTHPTHTEKTDPQHPKDCTCPSQSASLSAVL
ncbi:pinensin family lanthipeptide [uncultured Pedobacter sp.]|uniref:pinensin family lanthipeptide n=1 Tax=uncultured Pedobacter sp. TaxID=246139 RepID=UPI0025F01E0F|nr:pinensin family lanthipeptide [uncultured Pedobacter sp.]